MINWEELGKFGISKEMLEQSGQLDGMLKGYKTNRTCLLYTSGKFKPMSEKIYRIHHGTPL